MKFRQLALKNVRGNWHQYSAFFLSSVFSVMIFFIYAAFIFHPDVINGQIIAASGVRQGMVICEFIIMIFSFFFVLYSNSAFLKTRKKEFGLLSLFGMTNKQIRRMVIYENTAISMLAIAVGIGFGMLFSKLFFMAIAVLLDAQSPIRFLIPAPSVWITVIGFFLLFQLISLITLFQVGGTPIIDLLKASQKPKTLPVFSRWLVLLSLVCIGGGYYMAYTMGLSNVIIYMMPVVALVIVGTYFLFTQSSVAILRRLQRNKPLYYRKTNLITVSQLVFKLKDNARILFMVSILSAVILTASGTFYTFFQASYAPLMAHFPQTIGYVEKGQNTHQVISPDNLKHILEQDGVKLQYEVHMTGVTSSIEVKALNKQKLTVLIMPETDYNAAAKHLDRDSLTLQKGHAVFVYPYPETSTQLFSKGDTVSAVYGKEQVDVQMDGQVNGAVALPRGDANYMLVVDDEQYRILSEKVPEQQKVVVYGYELQNWQTTNDTVKKIEQLVPADQKGNFTSRVEQYMGVKQMSSLTLFIGIFISFLFFIASGSMLYFKMFTELQEDQAHFRSLTRIGITEGEIRRIVSLQVGILFFIPCAVGIVHMAFAMKALGNLLLTTVWQYSIAVIVIYLAMQSLYFLSARNSYLKKILQHTV